MCVDSTLLPCSPMPGCITGKFKVLLHLARRGENRETLALLVRLLFRGRERDGVTKRADLLDRINDLEAENKELRATVYILKKDLDTLGPENARLMNAYAAARAEIARLKPQAGRKRGRPKKEATGGSYEEYLAREAMQLVTESMQNGGKKISEKTAAILADKKIRATAKSLQEAGMPGAFRGLAATYPADEDSIANAFRRGKRALRVALTRKNQTKK